MEACFIYGGISAREKIYGESSRPLVTIPRAEVPQPFSFWSEKNFCVLRKEWQSLFLLFSRKKDEMSDSLDKPAGRGRYSCPETGSASSWLSCYDLGSERWKVKGEGDMSFAAEWRQCLFAPGAEHRNQEVAEAQCARLICSSLDGRKSLHPAAPLLNLLVSDLMY